MLINQLDRGSNSKDSTIPVNVEFARFIVENLVYLDYGVVEEVFTVIHAIDKIISTTGVALLQSIENEDDSAPLQTLAQRSIVLSLVVSLKMHLKTVYNLTEAKCRAFNPKKPSTAKDNKAISRTTSTGVFQWSDIPFLEKPFENALQMQEQLEAVHSFSISLILVSIAYTS
jgi:hypothetical protein